MNNLLTMAPVTPEFIDIIILLARWFQDSNKVAAWLQMHNINLGRQTPIEMLHYSREKQLLRWIRDNMPYEV